MSCHVISCLVMSWNAMECCHMMSCHGVSCDVIECHIMSCHVIFSSHHMMTFSSLHHFDENATLLNVMVHYATYILLCLGMLFLDNVMLCPVMLCCVILLSFCDLLHGIRRNVFSQTIH